MRRAGSAAKVLCLVISQQVPKGIRLSRSFVATEMSSTVADHSHFEDDGMEAEEFAGGDKGVNENNTEEEVGEPPLISDDSSEEPEEDEEEERRIRDGFIADDDEEEEEDEEDEVTRRHKRRKRKRRNRGALIWLFVVHGDVH